MCERNFVWSLAMAWMRHTIEMESNERFICWLLSMFAWPRYLPRALPAVPMFSILISPKYEPALSDAITVFPLSPTTCSRPRFTMYISFPTSPAKETFQLATRKLRESESFTFPTNVVAGREENWSQPQNELTEETSFGVLKYFHPLKCV